MKSTWEAPYKFNGKELDSESGLYYNGARYYIPELSIWGSVDPLSDNTPWASAYAYCINNPVRLIDPDGRDWFENELTGDVVYQKNYRRKDAELLGENWKWMGKNNMFGESQDKLYNSFTGTNDASKDDESFGFKGERAKDFMSERGYEQRTKSEQVVVKIITQNYTEANGDVVSPHAPIVETLDVKSRTYKYVQKGLYSNCIETKKNLDRSYTKTPNEWEVFEVNRGYFYTNSKPNHKKDYSWEIYHGSQIMKSLFEIYLDKK